MFNNKKAQSLPLNTIVIAAISLIVLVILIMIFTGRLSIFGIGVNKATEKTTCESYKISDTSVCKPVTGIACPSDSPKQAYGNFELGENQICCCTA